jgi:hypothetical protein
MSGILHQTNPNLLDLPLRKLAHSQLRIKGHEMTAKEFILRLSWSDAMVGRLELHDPVAETKLPHANLRTGLRSMYVNT